MSHHTQRLSDAEWGQRGAVHMKGQGDIMAEPVDYLGKKLRELAAEHGSGVTQLGSLFVRVTNHGNGWALELSDDKPIDSTIVSEWATAVGVTVGSQWRGAYQGREWRVEWIGTEEPALEGPQAFYLGGG